MSEPCRIVLQGEGYMLDFCVNGEHVADLISWANECIISTEDGLLVDGKPCRQYTIGDVWTASAVRDAIGVFKMWEFPKIKT